MRQYVTLDKRSKKVRKEYYSRQRHTWGELNPVTRSVPSGKVYNRKKEKHRIGVESRNGFDADFYFRVSTLAVLYLYKTLTKIKSRNIMTLVKTHKNFV